LKSDNLKELPSTPAIASRFALALSFLSYFGLSGNFLVCERNGNLDQLDHKILNIELNCLFVSLNLWDLDSENQSNFGETYQFNPKNQKVQ
jgi:hypothetical protein